MPCFDLFPTKIWVEELDLDVSVILDKIIDNGEQRTDLVGIDDLSQALKDKISEREDLELPEMYLHYWVNYNKPGDSNYRHHHTDNAVFLSGVYYLKVPEDSGRIIFYDPRVRSLGAMSDNKYYVYEPEVSVQAQPGMVVYFPSWLEHGVEPNESNEDRISIAFNLINKDELDRYKDMENFCDQKAIATRPDGRVEYFTT